MPGLWTITTRTDGEVLTANKYNSDRQEVVDNFVPSQMDDYSSTVGQMQSTVDPGEIGTESQATSLAGELERLRFLLAEITGKTHWYASPDVSLDELAFGVWS